jgi:tetratricopeptide (TPR) repeat protein
VLLQQLPGQTERSRKLPGSSSFIRNARPVPRSIASRSFCRIEAALLFMLAAMLLLAQASGGQPKGAVLSGVVHDPTGRAVGNAHVMLQGESSQVLQETTTDATGRFTFNEVATGTFTLTASSKASRSAGVVVTVTTPGEQPPIELVLRGDGAQQSASALPDSSQAIQFADNPDFAIAAVTDWTAAGGHGSDSSLRTSEALTREAVKLQSDNTRPTTAAVPSGGGKSEESESELRAAVAKNPKGFAANYRLGHFYVQAGRYEAAIPPLQAAYAVDPANFDNEYDLALALKMAGSAAQAREHVLRLLARRPNADLHRMQGELDEKLGDPLSAVRGFQDAASEDPSEDNYFTWGSELLFHRAIWQAKEVFDEGARLYPHSARMLTARGAALFAGAKYDEAALDLCEASDLNPQSAEAYLFMGKIEIAAPNPLPCVVAKLARFEKLQPANSLADYYYAMALWKQQGHTNDPQVVDSVKAMLTRAVNLDPQCADGYLQLGNLSADQKQWAQAIDFYLKAIQANSDLSDAHYRLGVAYQRVGENAKAGEQFQLHDAIAREQAAEIQRQREAVKQFLVVLPGQSGMQQAR